MLVAFGTRVIFYFILFKRFGYILKFNFTFSKGTMGDSRKYPYHTTDGF